MCNSALIVKGRVSQLFCDTLPLGSYTALLFYLGLFAEKLVDLCQSFVPCLRKAAGKKKEKELSKVHLLDVCLPDDKNGSRDERCSVADKEERVAQRGH